MCCNFFAKTFRHVIPAFVFVKGKAATAVIPANDCMDAGGRATQEAKAEAGIHVLSNRELSLLQFLTHYWRRVTEKMRHFWVKRDAKANSLARLKCTSAQRILVLCYGNIYRSALVGRTLSDKLSGMSVEVKSAGFFPKEGRSSPSAYVKLLRQYDIDLSSHRSSVSTPALLDWADTVLVMDAQNYESVALMNAAALQKTIWLGALTEHDNVEIIDPYGREDRLVLEIVERLLLASNRLVEQIKEKQNSVIPAKAGIHF